MLRQKTRYSIETQHPVNGRKVSEVCVTVNYDGATRYVDGRDFGCSRDYATTSDETAIACLMREHGRTLLSMAEIDENGQLVKQAPKIARTRIVKDKDNGEYVVKAYGANGERLEACDYYTDDKDDAKQTARRMTEGN